MQSSPLVFHRPSLRLGWLGATVVLATLLAQPAAAARTRCDVAFHPTGLPEGTIIGFADLKVGYSRPKIFAPDAQGQVVCHGVQPGSAAGARNSLDNASQGTMTIALASEAGVGGDTPAFRCEVYSAGTSLALPGDFFDITTLQARDAALAPIVPLPTFVVGEIRCGEAIPTTTTSTTSTTLSPSSTTTTTLAPEPCTVTLQLLSSARIRRLRLDLDYSQAEGHPARPMSAACRGPSGTGLGATAGAAPDTLKLDLVSPTALKGPRDLITCDFVPTTGLGRSEDFQVTVLLASDAAGAPLAGLPPVAATDVVCAPPTTSTTSTSLAPTTTVVTFGVCGDANGNGKIEASDALITLRAAVGLPSACTFTPNCDVDASGGKPTASDALRILRASVGQEVTLVCPA